MGSSVKIRGSYGDFPDSSPHPLTHIQCSHVINTPHQTFLPLMCVSRPIKNTEILLSLGITLGTVHPTSLHIFLMMCSSFYCQILFFVLKIFCALFFFNPSTTLPLTITWPNSGNNQSFFFSKYCIAGINQHVVYPV